MVPEWPSTTIESSAFVARTGEEALEEVLGEGAVEDAAGVVLVGALVIGSGVLRSKSPTPAQRAYAIESVLRCPSCEDLSVAQSSAATAVTVRATVAQQIAAGRSDQQIEAYLKAPGGAPTAAAGRALRTSDTAARY